MFTGKQGNSLARISKEVASRTGFPASTTRVIIVAFFDAVKQSLFFDRELSFAKFGRFYNITMKAGLFTLPNGQKIWKNERKKPAFAFNKSFQNQMVNETSKSEFFDETQQMDDSDSA